MNSSLRPVFTLVIIFSYAFHVHATTLVDDLVTIKGSLQMEDSEDQYEMFVNNPSCRRLSKRSSNNIRAQCDQVREDLQQLGIIKSKKKANFEKFPNENANNLVNYKFMEWPIEGMQNKMRKVVRLTDKLFLRTKDTQRNELESPVEFPNGLFIADSGFNRNMMYLFTKTRGSNTLWPIAMLPCRPKIVETETENVEWAPDASESETAALLPDRDFSQC